MKRINIAYWIITALFAGFMIFSGFGGPALEKQAVELMNVHMGYPLYFIQWISMMKIIGAITILLPLVPERLKDPALRVLHRSGHRGLFLHCLGRSPVRPVADALIRRHVREGTEGVSHGIELRGGA